MDLESVHIERIQLIVETALYTETLTIIMLDSETSFYTMKAQMKEEDKIGW